MGKKAWDWSSTREIWRRIDEWMTGEERTKACVKPLVRASERERVKAMLGFETDVTHTLTYVVRKAQMAPLICCLSFLTVAKIGILVFLFLCGDGI